VIYFILQINLSFFDLLMCIKGLMVVTRGGVEVRFLFGCWCINIWQRKNNAKMVKNIWCIL
jgi:hypothetical protein